MERPTENRRATCSAPLDRCARTWGPDLALLRIALALVFVWFGLPKLVDGLSPAEGLVRATIPWLDPDWFVPALGVVEALIGLCLLRDRWLTIGLVLMAGHMVGAAMPLFVLPEVAWKAFPVATLEGQYVLKNTVLVAAAFVIARGRRRRLLPQSHASRSRSAHGERPEPRLETAS